jgi:mono/diheme cytochrome c family protein
MSKRESKTAVRKWGKRLFRIASYGLLAVVGLLVVAITATIGWRPFIGPKVRPLTNRKFEASTARLERGRYLVEGPLHCFECHSQPDYETPGAPPLPGTKGGGRNWSERGFPWLFSPNITPDQETGAGKWTDDMWARAIREGIGHDGRALFPLMPYRSFSRLSDEDLASVVVYLRNIESISERVPQTKTPFPLSLMLNILPEPLNAPVPHPDMSTPISRGKYLAQISDCEGCHTPRGRMTPTIVGMEFAGGNVMGEGKNAVAVTNITPDASGISYYDEALFLKVMRTGHVGARQLNPIMPWVYLREMSDADLKDLFAYLQTIPAVHHTVDNTEPATECPKCGQAHGFGNRN